MHLTQTTDLARFQRGGQVDIDDRRKRLVHRGEIKNVHVTGEGNNAKLVIELSWMARGNQYPDPKQWSAGDSKTREVRLSDYEARETDRGQILLTSRGNNDVILLMPSGSGDLEKSDVTGL